MVKPPRAERQQEAAVTAGAHRGVGVPLWGHPGGTRVTAGDTQ